MMDIESSNFKWSSLTSLHHTKHIATGIESTEDDNNRSFEVCFLLHLSILLCKLLSLELQKHRQ
jgi:hypothetical protein